MKKLFSILPLLFLALAINAQQTEDEVYVGKKYGSYKGTGIIIPDTDKPVKPVNGEPTVTGIVIKGCKGRCNSFTVQKSDGTLVIVGTKDYGFTVPGNIVGRNIIVEGIDPAKRVRERSIVKKAYQNDIQFAATGIIIIN